MLILEIVTPGQRSPERADAFQRDGWDYLGAERDWAAAGYEVQRASSCADEEGRWR